MNDTHDSNAPQGGEAGDSDERPFTQYDSRDEAANMPALEAEPEADPLIAARNPTRLDTAAGTRDDNTRDDNTRDEARDESEEKAEEADEAPAAGEQDEPPLFSDVNWEALNDSGVARSLVSSDEVLESIEDLSDERYEAEDYGDDFSAAFEEREEDLDPVAAAIAEASAQLEASEQLEASGDSLATEDIAYEEDEGEEAASHLIGHVEEVKSLLPRQKHPEQAPIQLIDEDVDRDDVDSPDRALDRGTSGRTTLSIDFSDFERQRTEELSTQDREIAAVEAAFEDLFDQPAEAIADPVMAAEAEQLLNLDAPTVDKTSDGSRDTGTGSGSKDEAVPVVGESGHGSADIEPIYAGATEDHSSKAADPNRGMTVADASRHGSRSGSNHGTESGTGSKFGDGRRSSSLVNMAQDSKGSKGTSMSGTRRLSGSFRLGDSSQFAGYTLLERVAEGGMGVVFKARQEGLNRIVAVKIMKGGGVV